MALNSYANLKTAIAAFADVSAADISAVLDDIITIAENRIYNDLRTRDFTASLSATISDGFVAIPSDYLDWIAPVAVDGSDTTYNYPLTPATQQFINDEYPERESQSKPEYVATEGTKFIFGPYPDSGTTWLLKGTYKKKLVRVSTSATDNALFARRPEIYLYASLVEVEKILGREARLPIWESQYRSIRDLLNREDSTSTGHARPYL